MVQMIAVVVLAACPHPYFPMEPGLKLTFRTGGSDEVKVSFPEAGKMQLEIGAKTGVTEARCTEEGIVTQAGGLEGAALQASGVQMNVKSSEGVAFPPPEAMVPGKPWRNKLSVELMPPADVKLPGGYTPKVSTTFEKESEVVGEEKVTVAAGTFKALKVKNKTTASTGSGDQGRAMESFAWLVSGVGLVKVQTGDSVDLELIKIERPAAPAAPKKKASKPQAAAKVP